MTVAGTRLCSQKRNQFLSVARGPDSNPGPMTERLWGRGGCRSRAPPGTCGRQRRTPNGTRRGGRTEGGTRGRGGAVGRTRRPAREAPHRQKGRAAGEGNQADAVLFAQSSAPAAGAGTVSPSAARPPRATAGPHATPQTRPSRHRLPYMPRPRRRRPQTPPRGSDRGRMWHHPQQGASAP